MRQLRVSEEQAKIAGRQAEILEHQVDVERAALRADLYERRLAVFKACREFVRATTLPSFDFEQSYKASVEMSDQLEQAEFLFAGEVRKKIQDINQQARDVVDAQVSLMVLRSSGNVAHEFGTSQRVTDLREHIHALTTQLNAHLPNLAQVMGEEMRLYIPRAKSKRDSTPD
ncbi:hypothetical protein ADT71_03490 [Novosphingobium sp. ST904]|nr:hypothetical protein ADT71_03490 [Novosphingobium sp. ST904]